MLPAPEQSTFNHRSEVFTCEGSTSMLPLFLFFFQYRRNTAVHFYAKMPVMYINSCFHWALKMSAFNRKSEVYPVTRVLQWGSGMLSPLLLLVPPEYSCTFCAKMPVMYVLNSCLVLRYRPLKKSAFNHRSEVFTPWIETHSRVSVCPLFVFSTRRNTVVYFQR